MLFCNSFLKTVLPQLLGIPPLLPKVWVGLLITISHTYPPKQDSLPMPGHSGPSLAFGTVVLEEWNLELFKAILPGCTEEASLRCEWMRSTCKEKQTRSWETERRKDWVTLFETLGQSYLKIHLPLYVLALWASTFLICLSYFKSVSSHVTKRIIFNKYFIVGFPDIERNAWDILLLKIIVYQKFKFNWGMSIVLEFYKCVLYIK